MNYFAVISTVSVLFWLLAVLDARRFLPNGQQNGGAEQEDSCSPRDAVRPREVPLCDVELNTIIVNFCDEDDGIDDDSCHEERHCSNT